MDFIKIDYHLSYYRSSCHQLGIGILPPKEFDRIDVIRQASLVAIALEIGVIHEIGDAHLKPMEHKAVMAFIRRYENQEIAA